MDGSHGHDQHQKDFMASLFPTEPTHDQQPVSMFPFNPPSSPHLTMPQHINSQMSMDILENMVQMQGIEQQPSSPMSPQASYGPQSLIEQQFKLSQLQQLQQLQNQIFQQQASSVPCSSMYLERRSLTSSQMPDRTYQWPDCWDNAVPNHRP